MSPKCKCGRLKTRLYMQHDYPELCWECQALARESGATRHSSIVRCPKCGETWEPNWDDGGEGEHIECCPECNEEFEISVHITFSFTSPARTP